MFRHELRVLDAYHIATIHRKNSGKAHVKDVVLNMQAVLEAQTIAARLQLVLEALLKQRNRLQALAALRVAEDG